MFGRDFSSSSLYPILLILIITTKILSNTRMKKIEKKQACRICHVDMWNPAYLTSYLRSCFKRVTHAQKLKNLDII